MHILDRDIISFTEFRMFENETLKEHNWNYGFMTKPHYDFPDFSYSRNEYNYSELRENWTERQEKHVRHYENNIHGYIGLRLYRNSKLLSVFKIKQATEKACLLDCDIWIPYACLLVLKSAQVFLQNKSFDHTGLIHKPFLEKNENLYEELLLRLIPDTVLRADIFDYEGCADALNYIPANAAQEAIKASLSRADFSKFNDFK